VHRADEANAAIQAHRARFNFQLRVFAGGVRRLKIKVFSGQAQIRPAELIPSSCFGEAVVFKAASGKCSKFRTRPPAHLLVKKGHLARTYEGMVEPQRSCS